MDHQRNNDTSLVFSATTPMLLAVSASEHINIPQHIPSILSTLQKNVRATFDRIDTLTIIPSHAASPIIYVHIRRLSGTANSANLTISASRNAPPLNIVDEALAQVGGSLTGAGWDRSSLNRGRASALL